MNKLRCAIYTRKSSEEGLDMEFNSLHAQREACEAYIASQKHEGWILLKDKYDDGGISGGTMNRSGLKALLDDIEAGKVDIVVVYKVDRLTRSLADFARMVEIFDEKKVSFVSVTQQFNTTSSMGRLTLNVLLSFAQFEREVTGERIRDKFLASAQKGIWMGGFLPLGYNVKDRKLFFNETNAAIVRHIFNRYLELKSVRLLADEVAAENLRSKLIDAIVNDEVRRPKATLSRAGIYKLLDNPIYIGKTKHKGKIYEGQHEGIINIKTWEEVQALLKNPNLRQPQTPRKTPLSPLLGKLIDAEYDDLVATFTKRRNEYHRYYISRRAKCNADRTGWRLPALRVEEIVSTQLKAFLSNPSLLSAALAATTGDIYVLNQVIAKANEFLKKTETEIFKAILKQAQFRNNDILFRINMKPILPNDINSEMAEIIYEHTVPLKMQRKTIGTTLVIPTEKDHAKEVDANKLLAIARAHLWWDDWLNGSVQSMKEIAARDGFHPSYVGDVMHLAFMDPKEIERMAG